MGSPLAALIPGGRPPGGSSVAALIAGALQTPLFPQEGPQFYGAAFARNARFAKPGPYQTELPPAQEQAFRQWVAQNRVPFDPLAKTVDYDMRGYFAATGGRAWQPGAHFPDTYKTPYDTTFSGESRYAKPHTPLVWQGNKLIDTRTGQVVIKTH